MPFQMKVSNEAIEGKDVVPAGIYDYKLVAFKPNLTKAGSGLTDLADILQCVNLNAQLAIINHPDFAERRVFDNMNFKRQFYWADFSHALGIPMETDGKDSWLPGHWEGNPAVFKESDPTTWVYKGPLVGRTGKFEIAVESYNNKEKNVVRRYFCAIEDCESKFPKTRHSTDLLKKSGK